LLKTKWETFVKAKFYRQFYLFAIYFFISLFAFGLRPRAIGDDDDEAEGSGNSTKEVNMNDTTNAPVKSLYIHNLTEILCNYSAIQEAIMQTEIGMMNTTDMYDNSTMPMDESDEWASFSECPLLDISTWENRVSFLLFFE
jgi:transient receptor potential cation channel subfamily V member 5